MPRRTANWRTLLLGIALGVSLMAVIHELRLQRTPDVELYRAVRNLVTDHFVAEVDPEDLVDEALRGMLAALDPYSRFYTAAEIAHLERETKGTFTGLGVVFRPPAAERRVLFPVPGSPASGRIDVGDRLLTLNGEDLSQIDAPELQARLSAADGKEVELGIESRSGDTRSERIAPAAVLDPTVRHGCMLEPSRGIAYLAVLAFSHETPAEFDTEIAHLQSVGMRALIIDLRGNPGGVLRSATQLVNRFVGDGDVVITRGRNTSEAYRAAPDEAHLAGLPLVLLVDDVSASASEVLAGAIQDYRVGAIVGTPTYGKGMVQTLQPYGKRAVVKVTTSLYYYTPPIGRFDKSHLVGVCRRNRARSVRRHPSPDANDPPPATRPLQPAPRAHRPRSSAGSRTKRIELLAPWPPDPQRDAAVALLSGELYGTLE